MKTYFLTFCLITGSLFAQASPVHFSTDCLLGPVLEYKLANQSWSGTDQLNQKISLFFYSNGLMEQTSAAGLRLFRWSAAPMPEHCGSLVLEDVQTGQQQLLEVAFTTAGITLSTCTGSLHIRKQPQMESAAQKAKEGVQGKWENTTYPFDNATENGMAYLRYQFRPNGTFERALGMGETTTSEAGEWAISQDGKRLILTFEQGGITVASLKYLEFDELVLEHTLTCEDPLFATASRDFYFNRQ